MILEALTFDLELRTTLFDPLRCAPSVADHQTTNVPDPLAFGNNPRLRQHPAAEVQKKCTFLLAFGIAVNSEHAAEKTGIESHFRRGDQRKIKDGLADDEGLPERTIPPDLSSDEPEKLVQAKHDYEQQLETARTALLERYADLELGLVDAVVMAGNVPLFTAPGTQAALVAGVARHVSSDGVLIAGFGLGRGYSLADYDAHAAAEGLISPAGLAAVRSEKRRDQTAPTQETLGRERERFHVH